MATPTIITLDAATNPVSDNLFVQKTTGQITNDTEEDIGAIKKANLNKILIQIQNVDSTNSLDWYIYGVADNNTSPPDFSTGKYVTLPNSSGTIASGANDIIRNTDEWDWILIRMKRTTPQQSASYEIYIRGEQ